MADMVVPTRAKRNRSPSPSGYVDALASPLEVLLKRRRKGDWAARAGGLSEPLPPPPPPPVWRPQLANVNPNVHATTDAPTTPDGEMEHRMRSSPFRPTHMSSDLGDATDDDDSADPSSSTFIRPNGGFGFGGVERRRARNWERLQQPAYSQTRQPAHSQPQPEPPSLVDSSPAARQARVRAHSFSLPPPQARQSRSQHHGAIMSSSPVRHDPPSSTPFREDQWTAEERMQEWGEEYASQNTLLHSLHLARLEAQQERDRSDRDRDSMYGTPHSSRVSMQGTPYSHRSHSHGDVLSLPQPLPTPFRYTQQTPSLGPSSPYTNTSTTSPAFFSPLPTPGSSKGGLAPHPSPVGETFPDHDHVRTTYEEANRLLAELNVQRMRRYHLSPSHGAGAGVGGFDQRGFAGGFEQRGGAYGIPWSSDSMDES